MNRIPAYTNAADFARSLSDLGLLYHIDDEPSEIFIEKDGEKVNLFTTEECQTLESILSQMSDHDYDEYFTTALTL